MSLLTTIDNIPLFSTVEEAITWGSTIGVSGFHTHEYQGEIGYMAGEDHNDINLVLGSQQLLGSSQDINGGTTNGGTTNGTNGTNGNGTNGNGSNGTTSDGTGSGY